MKSFKQYLLLEHKEWHQFIKQNGTKILERMGHIEKYASLSGEADHGSPTHTTNYIKTNLGLTDLSEPQGRWILRKFHTGKIPNIEDIPTSIARNLRNLEQLKKKRVTSVELKNINTPDELFSVVAKHDTKAMDEKVGLKQGKDYSLLGQNEHWSVYQPHNSKAACGLGRGTNWCTTSGSFEDYNEGWAVGPLTIIIPKNPAYPGEKYQHHEETHQFHDFRDKRVHSARPGPGFAQRPLPAFDAATSDRVHDAIVIDAIHDPNTDQNILLNHLDRVKENSYYYEEILQSKHHKSLIKTMLNSPDTPHENIRYGFYSPDESFAMAILKDKRLPHEDISYGFDSPHKSVAMATLNHPNLPREHIYRGLNSPHESVAMTTLEDNRLSPEHIYKGFMSRYKSVAMATLNHPNLLRQHIHRGLNSPHESVRQYARSLTHGSAT